VLNFAVTTNFKIAQVRTPLFAQKSNGRPGHRLLDGFEDVRDSIIRILRTHQKMNVLRHNHVGPKLEVPSITSAVEGVQKPESCSVGTKKRQPVEAAERQRMGVARLVPRLS